MATSDDILIGELLDTEASPRTPIQAQTPRVPESHTACGGPLPPGQTRF